MLCRALTASALRPAATKYRGDSYSLKKMMRRVNITSVWNEFLSSLRGDHNKQAYDDSQGSQQVLPAAILGCYIAQRYCRGHCRVPAPWHAVSSTRAQCIGEFDERRGKGILFRYQMFWQLLSGMIMMAIIALTTAPIEKNKDSAVRRYCFFLGTFSKNNVPSVGILP